MAYSGVMAFHRLKFIQALVLVLFTGEYSSIVPAHCAGLPVVVLVDIWAASVLFVEVIREPVFSLLLGKLKVSDFWVRESFMRNCQTIFESGSSIFTPSLVMRISFQFGS